MKELYRLAMDEAAHRAHVAERLAPIEQPDLRALLEATLEPTPDARPAVGELVGRLEDVADTLGDPRLARWCREHDWPAAAPVQGSLTSVEPRPLGGAESPATFEVDVAEVLEPAPTVRPAERRPLLGLTGLGAVGVGAVLLGTVGAAGVFAAWMATTSDVTSPMTPIPSPSRCASPSSPSPSSPSPDPSPSPTPPTASCGDPLELEPLAALGKLRQRSEFIH